MSGNTNVARRDLGWIAKTCSVCRKITDHRCRVDGDVAVERCGTCNHTENRPVRPEDLNVA